MHERRDFVEDPMNLTSLTPRERDILDHIMMAKTSKEIALDLGLSPRTVEIHRDRIMSKTGARNVVHLVLMVCGWLK